MELNLSEPGVIHANRGILTVRLSYTPNHHLPIPWIRLDIKRDAVLDWPTDESYAELHDEYVSFVRMVALTGRPALIRGQQLALPWEPVNVR